MANALSDLMTNYFATPPVLNPVGLDHGRQRVKIARTTMLAVHAAGAVHRLCRMKATDRVISVKIVNDGASTAATSVDWGIRTPAKTGGSNDDPAQISAAADECLVKDLDLSSAVVVPTERLGTGLTTMPARLGKELWEVAGISARPATGTEYEVVMLVAGDVATADEVVTTLIEYIAGD